MQTYSKSQLALRNGQDKDEIWVAYKGKIYVGGVFDDGVLVLQNLD